MRSLVMERLADRVLLAADGVGAVDGEERLGSHPPAFVVAHHTTNLSADVNRDAVVSSADGLLLVNAINQVLAETEAFWEDSRGPDALLLDVNGDGDLTPADFDAFLTAASGNSQDGDNEEGAGDDEEVAEGSVEDSRRGCAESDAVWCSGGQPVEDGLEATPPPLPNDLPEEPDEPWLNDPQDSDSADSDSADGTGDGPSSPSWPEEPGDSPPPDTEDPPQHDHPTNDGPTVDTPELDPTLDEAPDDGTDPTGTGDSENDDPVDSPTDPGPLPPDDFVPQDPLPDTPTSDSPQPPTSDCGDGFINTCLEPAPDPPRCPVQLRGGIAREGRDVQLDLQVDATCIDSFEVDWGDTIVETYDATEKPVHIYEDDDPTKTPEDDYTVVVTFTYAADYPRTDADPTSLTAVMTVKNTPPKARDDRGFGFATDEDSPFQVSDVVSNDLDDSLFDELTIASLDTAGTKGIVRLLDDGAIHYDPAGQFECLKEGEIATDTFRYAIHDDDDPATWSWATVTIEVQGLAEKYTLDFGGGVGYEDDRQPATAYFLLTPAARCGSVFVAYRPFSYDGPLTQATADASDWTSGARGVIEFKEGESFVTVDMVPDDDTIIEENEAYYFTADRAQSASFKVLPIREKSFSVIKDNEWRFVAVNQSVSRAFGPRAVETPFSPSGTSWVSASFQYDALSSENLNQKDDSTATVAGFSAAMLFKPNVGKDLVDDLMRIRFVCDSQTGYVYRNLTDGANLYKHGPLATAVGVEYAIHAYNQVERDIVVDFTTDLLVGGSIAKSQLHEFRGEVGDDIGKVGGSVRLQHTILYDGGLGYREPQTFNLKCYRGVPDED